MPIFEYRCNKCNTRFEHLTLHPSNDEDVNCPACGFGDITRVPSACNHKIIWKGVDPRYFYDSDGNWLPDKDPRHGM